MSALQEQFVTEARELIRQATDDLIVLERDGASPDRIDRVFRAFHTLKGSAGVVELPAMSIMLHAAEDLLASVRQGALGGSPDIIDAARAAGANFYLVKPVAEAELVRHVCVLAGVAS